MVKRIISSVMVFAVALCLLINAEAATSKTTFDKDDEWLIYMYICGTNLESLASRDVWEIQSVKLPPNVKILINMNGVRHWSDPRFEKYGDGIYLRDSDGFRKISSWKADMGRPDTLKNFLKFGEENYKADHRILIFWDHGGLNGLCYDDAFD